VNRIRTVIGVLAALLLGSSDGTSVAGIQGSGLRSYAVGPITRFGSVFVNGVEYSIAGAQITIDNQPGTEAQLRAGQIVAVKGTVNADGVTGTATGVSFNGDVRGPITQINSAGGSFVVLGQTVRVTGSTLFDDGIQPASLDGLQAGSLVEVSGFPNSAGEIVASRVDLAVATGLQVKGEVQALDTASHTFQINSLTVDYGAVSPTAALADGSIVEVQGAALTSTGELLATLVEVQPGLNAAPGERVDISGIITGFTSLLDFLLQGQKVVTDLNTHFVLHGIPLGLNIEVDVQGTVDASGVLHAKKVEVTPQGPSLLQGIVDSISLSSNTLSVLGANVTTSAATRLEDKSNQHLKLFSLTDLRVGDYVVIHGRQTQSGTLSAATVVRRDLVRLPPGRGVQRGSSPN
jgi:hypothetical protein